MSFFRKNFYHPFPAYCTLRKPRWISVSLNSIFPMSVHCTGKILWQLYRFEYIQLMVISNLLWYFCCVIKQFPTVHIHIGKSKIKEHIQLPNSLWQYLWSPSLPENQRTKKISFLLLHLAHSIDTPNKVVSVANTLLFFSFILLSPRAREGSCVYFLWLLQDVRSCMLSTIKKLLSVKPLSHLNYAASGKRRGRRLHWFITNLT